jgi:hypothetical protein
MLRHLLFSATLIGNIALSEEASALGTSQDLPVTIEVLSPSGTPIATASVRNAQEAMRHDVNHETGRWSGDSLYLKDGTRLPFRNKQELHFEVSAPGFESSLVHLKLRKRRNQVRVVLTPIDFDSNIETQEEPDIPFYRSIPLE